MRDALYFQSIIMELQRFWSEKGCLIWQPYYTQVGAGTMNPATFLRVLGPEPWNVAYVEPSIRPDDGRFGDNPYRLQQHYQFQVILKPDPGNPQELYLQSLQALGIKPEEHDIRFVEDNWESPALGAWGLGWEVWLDGQEITQFTYFQQAGGLDLDPVSVELTYGLERIAMALQGNYDFRKIQWNSSFTYGDVNYMAEKEHSQYYFETADIERVREMYRLYEEEANHALEKRLVLPAYDYLLKCSHHFNILDARGAVGVTERQALFGRMRELSKRVAEAYIHQREALGFPWLQKFASSTPIQEMVPLDYPPAEQPSEPADFLLEIGTEELPAADLESALEQLQALIPAMLNELRLEHGEVKIYGTPRRLAVLIKSLAHRQADLIKKVKGPPANRAFAQDGNLTPEALGFARSKGVEIKDLKKEEIDGGFYLVAEVCETGKTIVEVMPDKLVNLLANFHFDKSMRWNGSGVAFSRPIRWLVSLFGGYVVPFKYAGLTAGRETRGLRFRVDETFQLNKVGDYLPYLERQGILVDPEQRKSVIEEQVRRLKSSISADASVDEELLIEVANLVEAPTALLGNFNKSYLSLPPEVLIGVMKKHQRYFSVQAKDGSLMPYFIAVRNGDSQHLGIVARGNEEVIEARFADASFFIREDSRYSIDEFVPRLDTLIFHPKLGSMLDKTHRIIALTEKLVKFLNLDKKEAEIAMEAAALCKADLATKMVVEMTSLQGVIGRYYALWSGRSEEVARAIEEHYYPRFAGDKSPGSMAALTVGLADRLDSLTGLFAAGMAPSGTKDPFGLRRAAIGLVQNLINWNLDFDLRWALSSAAELQPIQPSEQVLDACFNFIAGRFENLLLEEGRRYDVVRAVLAEQAANPRLAVKNVEELSNWVAREDWHLILPAFSRCARITREVETIYPVNPDAFIEPQEAALYEAYRSVKEAVKGSLSVDEFLSNFVKMIPAINEFFDTVLVMTEEENIRQNRLGLLQAIVGLANGRADFSHLEGF